MLGFRFSRMAAPLALIAMVSACAGQQTVQAPKQQPAPQPPVVKAFYQQPEVKPNEWAFAGVPRYGRAILVNVPSAELIAFENGEPVLRSKVIVGKRRTPTPIMDTETSVVRFRPTWTPTPRMVREGYRPGTRRGGKGNPLGYLAIRLEPGMLIYLHGTNKPQLFERERRALSHGCVRVQKWDEVAAWVLETDVEEVRRRAFGRRTHDVGTNNVPVIIGYHLDFPNADGEMVTYPDVYRRGRGSYARSEASLGAS